MVESNSRMKVGIQTIVWEDRRASGAITRKEILRQAKDSGYDGVELFETPTGVKVHELVQELSDCQLHLTGLTGGSFHDRFQLATSLRQEPLTGLVPYLYCDEKPNKYLDDALECLISVGLHPHMFKPVQTLTEATKMLSKYRQRFAESMRRCPIHLMPDTAHCYIAGDDILRVLRTELSSIQCIHVKDWTPEFGRSYQFYARGFVPLGEGDVKLGAILNFLNEQQYSGWLIVEVDHPEDPLRAATISRDFLKGYGI